MVEPAEYAGGNLCNDIELPSDKACSLSLGFETQGKMICSVNTKVCSTYITDIYRLIVT